jgi:hypothetical protein
MDWKGLREKRVWAKSFYGGTETVLFFKHLGSMLFVLTGDVKYAPLITAAKNTTKYNNFCVVTRQARRSEGAFIRCHSAIMHITSWIRHTNASRKKTVANAT